MLLQSGVNGTATPPVAATPKPVPPPRDHLKVEKDGRIVNRTPAPQLPARITNNNNNVTVTPAVAVAVAATTPTQPAAEPTREQLDSIKKYQVTEMSKFKLSTILFWFLCVFSECAG